MLFHTIDDSFVILRSNGVFKQTTCYSRNGEVYAKHGSGFIKLLKHKTGSGHATTAPNISWEEIELPYTPEFSAQGVMLAKVE